MVRDGSVVSTATGGNGNYTGDIGSGPQCTGYVSSLSSNSYTVTVIVNNGRTTTTSATTTQSAA